MGDNFSLHPKSTDYIDEFDSVDELWEISESGKNISIGLFWRETNRALDEKWTCPGLGRTLFRAESRTLEEIRLYPKKKD